MKLFDDPTGPLLRYSRGVLYIDDLNPEIHTRWRMSRWEMFKLAFKFLRAAFVAAQDDARGARRE